MPSSPKTFMHKIFIINGMQEIMLVLNELKDVFSMEEAIEFKKLKQGQKNTLVSIFSALFNKHQGANMIM
jgi:hypothetical protein